MSMHTTHTAVARCELCGGQHNDPARQDFTYGCARNRRRVGRRVLVLDGVVYEANREALVRDGGGPSAYPWYATIEDGGACIDQRVPEGYFRTMRECHAAIREHHACALSA